MIGLHQRNLLNVKEVFLNLVGEAGDLKFFNQLFHEGLQQVVRMNNCKSNLCLYELFHCAGSETQ